jgi:hypothetical protein
MTDINWLFGIRENKEPSVSLAFHDASMAAERARYVALLDLYVSLKLASTAEKPKSAEPLTWFDSIGPKP